jgi:hypothetical protein
MIRIHNTATDEVIDREMTVAEFANYKEKQEKFYAEKAEETAKAEAKAELLARLGITAEEAKLLLS